MFTKHVYGFADLKNGVTKPIFLDFGSPRGGGRGFMRAWAWFVIIV